MRQTRRHPRIVEAHPIDDGFVTRDPEQARRRIARLRPRRQGPNLHKTKPAGCKAINAFPSLVEPGRQTHTVRKSQPPQRHRTLFRRLRQPPPKPTTHRQIHRRKRHMVRLLSRQRKNSGPDHRPRLLHQKLRRAAQGRKGTGGHRS